MSIGSKSQDFDFGGPNTGAPGDYVPGAPGSSAPMPADIARMGSATPLPSDVAIERKRERKRRSDKRKERRAVGGSPVGSAGGQRGEAQEHLAQAGGSSVLFYEDTSLRRRKLAVIVAVTVVLTLLSLIVLPSAGFQNPVEVLTCYGIWFDRAFTQLFNPSALESLNTVLESGHPAYFNIVNRANITIMTLLCGGVLAVAGTLYQSAFRNPIASPSMLGVSTAIQLGDVIMVLIFSAAATMHLGFRYLICYACVIVIMAVLFGAARLMTGKGRSLNVVNLLLCATVINQLIGVIITYITTFVFTLEEWEVFNSLSEAIATDMSLFGWGALLVTCALGLIPVALLRFRLNGLNFNDVEMKLLGIDAARLRLLALICGTILLMGVQVQMGTMAMLALVVPHISRMIFGAEFRKQFWGNFFMGAALLVLCRIIMAFIPMIGGYMPASVVLNFLVLPFFVWMLATQQRGWEQ